MKIPALIAAAALMATLVGCGGGSDMKAGHAVPTTTLAPSATPSTDASGGKSGAVGDYCTDFAALVKKYAGLNVAGDMAALKKEYKNFPKLAAKAPAGLQDEWAIFYRTLEDVRVAAVDAHITVAEVADVMRGETPPGAVTAKLPAVKKAVRAADSVTFRTASKKINDHAVITCKITFPN